MERMVNDMRRIREGMYEIGIVEDRDYKLIIVVNLNNGTIVFNNSNKSSGGAWTDTTPIAEIMKEGCKFDNKYKNEKWYALYKKFVQEVSPDEYNTMIEKMNNGII